MLIPQVYYHWRKSRFCRTLMFSWQKKWRKFASEYLSMKGLIRINKTVTDSMKSNERGERFGKFILFRLMCTEENARKDFKLHCTSTVTLFLSKEICWEVKGSMSDYVARVYIQTGLPVHLFRVMFLWKKVTLLSSTLVWKHLHKTMQI